MRCINLNIGRPDDRLNIMTPSCLSVDKAIIFFISISDIAIMPAISIVMEDNKIKLFKYSEWAESIG